MPAPMVAVSMQGLAEMKNKLDARKPPHAAPFRRAMVDLGKEGKRLAIARAPKGARGRLAKRNRYQVARSAVPTYVVITNSATNKGYRYGFALNAGHARRKSGRRYEFHRRQGGGSTKDWFEGIKGEMGGFIRERIAQAERETEGVWNR